MKLKIKQDLTCNDIEVLIRYAKIRKYAILNHISHSII